MSFSNNVTDKIASVSGSDAMSENKLIANPNVEKSLVQTSSNNINAISLKTFNDIKENQKAQTSDSNSKKKLNPQFPISNQPFELIKNSEVVSKRINIGPGASQGVTKIKALTGEASIHEEIQIARKQMETVGKAIEDINERNALIFDRTTKNFIVKKITIIKEDELKNCVKMILEKIENISNYELSNGELENAQSFDEIISHLESAKWSRSFFKNSSNDPLDRKLELSKKAIESVKKQVILRYELSADLVKQLLGKKLESSDLKMTLHDLSLVFPKIINLPDLLLNVMQILNHLRSTETDMFQLNFRIKLLLEFCIKCFENEVGLDGYENKGNDCPLRIISEFATSEIKNKLSNTYQNAYQSAIKRQKGFPPSTKEIRTVNNNPVECVKEIKSHNAVEWSLEKIETMRNNGFYHLLKEKKAKKEQIPLQIAKSIVKKTASELVMVPLDELLSGKVDSDLACPFYTHMAVTINNLSYIVASDILAHSDVSERRKVIGFYVNVIKECIALGDFASAYSLKLGFDLNCIYRLKDTWDQKTLNCIKDYNELFKNKNYYRNLFAKMKECESDYFIIPPSILGVQLNFIENNLGEKTFNEFQLRRLAGEVILPFQNIKKRLLSLSEDKILKTNETIDLRLNSLQTSLPDLEDLSSLSEKIEPPKEIKNNGYVVPLKNVTRL